MNSFLRQRFALSAALLALACGGRMSAESSDETFSDNGSGGEGNLDDGGLVEGGSRRDAGKDQEVEPEPEPDIEWPEEGVRRSCVGLVQRCGANRDGDCCEESPVIGGTFIRFYDAVSSDASDPSFYASLSDYRLDTYEVTVGRFRAFVERGPATQIQPPRPGDGAYSKVEGSGWDPKWNVHLAKSRTELGAALSCSAGLETWSPKAAGHENRPINCVTWYEAFAFCAWDGARLPTGAEWNYAAAGGDEQRIYPWGAAAPTPAHASFYVNDTAQCMGDGIADCYFTDLVIGGTKTLGVGRWGHAELGGNVAEWGADRSGLKPYPCLDCLEMTQSDTVRVWGGDFMSRSHRIRATASEYYEPETRSPRVGFRCARDQ